MNEDRIEEGRFTAKGKGLGTVTPEMVTARARELAVIAGRPNQMLDSDLDQARRELTGEERLVPETTAEEALPEDERWDPNAGSRGKKTPVVPAPDEQTFAEKLVEEGAEDAEQDRMLDATRDSMRKDNE